MAPRASTARSYAFPPRSRGIRPARQGGSACLHAGPGGQDARVGGTGRGFQQRAAQAAICRGSKASRGEARRQPRLSRGASRSAQRGEARQVALGRRSCARATAPRGWTGIMASAARSTGGCSTSRMASAPSASCRPGARSASIIATRRDRCAGSCATSATPRSGCSATIAGACGRRAPMSTASAWDSEDVGRRPAGASRQPDRQTASRGPGLVPRQGVDAPRSRSVRLNFTVASHLRGVRPPPSTLGILHGKPGPARVSHVGTSPRAVEGSARLSFPARTTERISHAFPSCPQGTRGIDRRSRTI